MFGLGFFGLGVEDEILGMGVNGEVRGGGIECFQLNTFLYLYYDNILTFNFISNLELVKKFV